MLNVALFGQTAKEWREANPDARGNVRDNALLEQLVVLTNLESLNAVLIRQGLPANQFVPALMEHLEEPYYAALLTAAEHHGAAHHRPQVFHVVTLRTRPRITCGSVQIDFIARKNVALMPTRNFKTPRGYLKVSTPEVTAFDIVGYPHYAGGLDNIATVLTELAESLDAGVLASIAKLSPVAWCSQAKTVGGSSNTDLAGRIRRRFAVAIQSRSSHSLASVMVISGGNSTLGGASSVITCNRTFRNSGAASRSALTSRSLVLDCVRSVQT